jgi:hypothetical protein
MNFNFSGMFGGGFTNNLNKNNFDFSAFAPKQEEKVTDPIDIVSNNTPESKVEVLEGAADVVVTKQPEVKYSPAVTNAIVPTTPDPITDAIQSVKPKPLDLGMDFSVAPETAPISGLTSNIPVPSGTPATGGFMDVGAGQTGVSSDVASVGVEKAYDLLDGSLESNNQIEDINNYLSGQQFTDYMSESDSNLSALGDYKKAEGATTDLLNQVGLPKALGVEGKYGGYKNYTYNGETNQYELTADTERSALDVAAPELIKAAAVATFTAGVGSAISSGFGVSSTTGAAIAGGASSAAQGGDFGEVLVSALSAGLAEEVKAASEAASVIGATKEAAAYADTLKTIKGSIDLVQAVEDGNVLSAVSSALDLSGNGAPSGFIKEALGTTDAQTSGILKVIDKQLQGESLEDSIKAGAATWVREGGIKEIDLDIDFGNGDWETPEAIKVIGDKLVEGASWANENLIKPVVKTVEQVGGGAIEAASEANRFVQREIIDEVQGFLSEQNQTFQTALEPIKEDFSKLNQTVRTELANFDTEYLQPVKNDISQINKDVRIQLAAFDDETLQPIKKDIEDVITKVDTTLSAFNKDYIKPIDERLSQTNKDVRDQLANFDKDYLQPIKNDLSENNKAFQGKVDEIQLALSETNKGFRDELSGFEDTYLNPIKEDVKGLAGDLKTGLSNTNKTFQGEVDRLEDYFSETNQGFRDELSGFEDTYLNPIKEDVKGLAGDLKTGLSNTNKTFQGEVDRLEDYFSETNQGFRDELSGFEDTYLNPIKEDVKGLAGDLKTGLSETNENFRQGLSDFEDDYLQPIKGDIESLAGDLKTGLSDTNKYVREQLAGFDDDVLQPIKNEIEDLIGGIDGLDVDMSGVKDMLSSVWDALGGLTTGLAATQEAAGKPSGNFGELAKMNTQYGEQYQFEDIRNNSLLNNELFS